MFKKGLITTILMLGALCALVAQQTMVYKDVNLAYKEGVEFYEKGLYSTAQQAFLQVIDRSKAGHEEVSSIMLQNAELRFAQSAMRLERPDGEELVLAFVKKYSPSTIANQAQKELGDYYYAQKDYKKAVKYYSKVNALSLTNEEITEIAFKTGYAYFVDKKYKKAQSQLKRVKEVKTSEYYEAANYYYGITAFLEDDRKEAIASFKRIENSKKYSHIIPYYNTQIYFADKNYGEVISYGEKQLQRNNIKNRREINQLVGQAYFEKKNFKKALPFLEEFSNSSSRLREEDLYQVAYTEYKNKKYNEAIKNFEELTALKSSLGQNSLYNLADCHLKTNDKLSARNAFKAASQMNYDREVKTESQFNYAKLSYDLKDDKEAINGLRAVPKTSANYREAQELLSSVFLRTKNYSDAIKTLEAIPSKSLKLREAYQKVTFNRGVQYFNDANLGKAREMLAKSLDNPIDQKTKALTYYWLGEIDHLEKKYAGSIQNINQFLTVAKGLGNLPDVSSLETGNYTQGYNYLKKDDYAGAQTYFFRAIKGIEDNSFRISDNYIKTEMLSDAILRNGDCYFKRNKYPEALINYNKVISCNFSGKDYAMFQKGVIEGITGKPLDKILTLNRLTRNFPKSEYADDALLELGNTYFQIGKEREASASLNKLVNDYKGKSDLVNKALLQLGLVAYNQNETDKALNYYQQVFTNAPYSKEAKDALQGIEEIYIERGETDKYFAFLNSVPGYKVTDEAKDSLTFRTAETQYSNGDYDRAITSYSSYIRQFPNGRSIITAYYQRGESNFTKKDYTKALVDYEYVSERGPNQFFLRATRKAAYIASNFTKQQDKAYLYYKKLSEISTDPDDVYASQLGAMRGAYATGNDAGTSAMANNLLANSRATNRDKAEAHYYKGKLAMKTKSYTVAETAFKKVKTLIDNAWAAEAHYQLAYILYERRSLDKAQEMALSFSADYPDYIDWYARSIILLADIFAEKDDLFNAKASLESVIDNYEGDQSIIDMAKVKLQKLKQLGKDRSRINNNAADGDMDDN
jgi:TolA-binding protein